jgi:nucleoid-associated protein YgaU
MGAVPQAVLEFDEEVQAPWRPRLVPVVTTDDAPALPRRPHPTRHSPSRVGVCRPGEPSARPRTPRPGTRGSVRCVPATHPGQRSRPAPGHARRGRVRLTRRARRLAAVLMVASGVALGSWLGPLLHGGGGDLRLAGVNSVVVQPGDTLWSIAGSLGGDDDVRAVVDEIQELNGLEGSALVPGQVLVLP